MPLRIPKTLPPHLPPPPFSPRALCDLLLSLSAARFLPKGQQLHAHLIKSGSIPVSAFSSAPLLSNHLITFYARCGLPLLSRRAFLDSPLRPAAAWSALIAAFAQNDLPDLSLLSFRNMLLAGVPPNDHTFPSAAKAAAALSLSTLGRTLHSLALKTAFASDVFVASALLDMYAKCTVLLDARQLFDEMPHRNVVSYSALISGYAQIGSGADALSLFKLALADNNLNGVNDFTYSCIVRVCSTSTLLQMGSLVHGHCTKTSFDASPFVGSSLISLYSKCGIITDAYKMFDEMTIRNLGAWNSILIASAQHGHTGAAFARYREMEAAGVRPNFITFLCLLTACSHSGLVEEGRRFFALMSDHGIEPSPQHYSCMVDLLGRAGRLPEAVEFVEKMPMEPTESVWGALLTGCRIHGDTETAAYAAGRLFAAGSTSSGAHMLLSNAYAAAGLWAEAAGARKAMRDRGVRKETGLSWVEEAGGEGRVHTFVSGDTRHPRSAEIYAVLEEVGEAMEAAGYVADTRWVLRAVDGEEKVRSVGYHCERLAIGFGLLTLPPGRPIRVMKNLRVCGDCHTAIKYVTKVTGRTVILRDNNRFHRFEDGVCSCGDYW